MRVKAFTIIKVVMLLAAGSKLCFAQANYLEKDREILIEEDSASRYRIGLSFTYNYSLHDYDNLNMANDYCEECFANTWGSGYSYGLAVEYLLDNESNYSPSLIMKVNYEYMPAHDADNNYKIFALARTDLGEIRELIATVDFETKYDLYFISADILYKIKLPGTGIFVFLGPSLDYNTKHQLYNKFEILQPGNVALSKPYFWQFKKYKYSEDERKVTYKEDVVKDGNFTRIGFKAGVTFPITFKRFSINPFFQFYYTFRNYESYEESQINAWCCGLDFMFSL